MPLCFQKGVQHNPGQELPHEDHEDPLSVVEVENLHSSE